MKRRSIRGLAVLLAAIMIVTMMPLTASAASKNPAKVKIKSYSVAAVSKTTNKTTVTVKWKKASKATGYQIYAQDYTGKWRKLKTVKKSVTTLKIKNVPAGYFRVKVRAVRKYKKKNYYGSYSAVKGGLIASPFTLEKYVNKFEPSLKGKVFNGTVVTFSGNTSVFTFDLAQLPEFEGVRYEDFAEEDWAPVKTALYDEIGTEKATYTSFCSDLTKKTGIKSIKARIRFTLNGTEVVHRDF